MTLPEYLQNLIDFKSLPDIEQALTKAEKAFAVEPVNRGQIDQVRSTLFRVLNNLVNERIQRKNKSWLPGFFFNYTLPLGLSFKLEEALNYSLSELARTFPIIDIDPIDLEPIDEPDWFVSMTGRIYRLTNLVEWIRQKNAYIYPDHCPMLTKDINNLKEICAQRNYSMQFYPKISATIQNTLAEVGLSIGELASLVVPELCKEHILAVHMLMTDHAYPLETAIDELQGLNYEQVNALLQFYSKGLRGEHFRKMKISQEEYGPHHTTVLHMMVEELGWSIRDAMSKLSSCNSIEIHSFYNLSPVK